MRISHAGIADVLLIEPTVWPDDRGFVFESFNRRTFQQATGLDLEFAQENHARSTRDVLRGLHYQVEQPQGKLIRVVGGEIFDVVVDLRPDSPTQGAWIGHHMSATNQHQLWIPPGMAHGFLTLSAQADVVYKLTDFYAPEHERCISWNDPQLAIDWPLSGRAPILSAKDAVGGPLPPGSQADRKPSGPQVISSP